MNCQICLKEKELEQSGLCLDCHIKLDEASEVFNEQNDWNEFSQKFNIKIGDL